MKNIRYYVITTLVIFSLSGCTSQSTKLAQSGSFRVQAINDGIHQDETNALCRENFESAKQTILLLAEKAKKGQPDPVATAIDQFASASVDALKDFAQKRDKIMSMDRDHERANALKYVTVDSKLFSEQGILNYIGQQFSSGSKKFLTAWDAAKEEWNTAIQGQPVNTTQPAN